MSIDRDPFSLGDNPFLLTYLLVGKLENHGTESCLTGAVSSESAIYIYFKYTNKAK